MMKRINEIIKENHAEHISEALQIVGEYYASIGNNEVIEELRSLQASTFDNAMDYEELSQITPKDKLTKVENDEGINMVKEIMDNCPAIKLVVAKKTINDKSMIHVIVVFSENETNENVSDVSDKVWRTLDAINDVEYYLHTIGDKMYKSLKWLHDFEVYNK